MEQTSYIDYAALERFVRGESHDAYEHFGCHYIPELEAHRFLVWAPHAARVTVTGDFNGWHWDDTPMQRLDCGV